MATILALVPRHEKIQIKPHDRKQTGDARVIIFPGVRYERIPDTKIAVAKAGKKTLKTA